MPYTIAELAQQLEVLNDRRRLVAKEVGRFEKKLEELDDEINEVRKEHSRLLVDEMGANGPDWKRFFVQDAQMSLKEANYFMKELRKIGFTAHGWSDETHQFVLFFDVPETAEDRQVLVSGIRTVLPFLVPDMGGLVEFGVFVPVGKLSLFVDPWTKRAHAVYRDGPLSVMSEAGTLEVTVAYIAGNY